MKIKSTIMHIQYNTITKRAKGEEGQQWHNNNKKTSFFPLGGVGYKDQSMP